MMRGTGIDSTDHPAAMPWAVKTILEHCAEAGVSAEMVRYGCVSEIVVPPQIITSGV